MTCGPSMVQFGCNVGEPVELQFFHADVPETPAVYQLVRVK